MQQATNNEHRKPKVSVCIITYNHADYIGQCLESVVSQEVDFDFEIVVGVDLSSDGTLGLVNQYAVKHPNLIRVIANTDRIGGCQNYLDTHAAARGDYIAVLDGDDMMFPGKLALQAKFLDAHPGIGIVWHTMQRSGSFSSLPAVTIPAERQVIHLTLTDQITFGTLGVHSSKMYRSSLKYLSQLGNYFLDFDINVCQLQHTSGALIVCNPLGGYRANTGISSAKPDQVAKAYYDSLIKVKQAMPQFRDAVAANIIHEFLHAARHLWIGTRPVGIQLRQTFHFRALALYVATYSKRKSVVRGIFR